jgi:hypothetical protein
MLLVIGVVAAMVAARIGAAGADVGAQAEQLAADIRYTQSLAQTRAERHCIAFAATSYTVSHINCTVAVNLPTAANPVALAAGITLVTGNALLVFNTLGRPFTDAAATTPLGAETVITLSAGGASRTVRVTPETGRVRVQ